MNKELQSQAAVILQQFSEGMSAVGDVAIKQLPNIAQQYIVYGFWKELLGSIILIAVVISCIVAIKEATRLVNETQSEEYFLIVVIAAPILLFSSIEAYLTVQSLLLNIFAPKVWLLIQIKSLVS